MGEAARPLPQQVPAPVRHLHLVVPEPAPRRQTCWYCNHLDVAGHGFLTTAQPGGGERRTRVAACEPGTGCRDGRVFHGPNGPAPHMPGEPCEVCGGEPKAARPRLDRRARLPLDASPGGQR